MFSDTSSFIQEGTRCTGTAVVTVEYGLWVEALPPGTLAQRAKLIALDEALTLDDKCAYWHYIHLCHRT